MRVSFFLFNVHIGTQPKNIIFSGEVGAPGPQGMKGMATVTKGETGPRGASGDRGLAGDKGKAGIPGEGRPGEKGDTG